MKQEHYYTKKPESKIITRKIEIDLRNNKIKLVTSSGLFSVKKVDKGI